MFVESTVPDSFIRGLVLSVFALLWVILLVRVVGLRSFSKMTNFDFVTTVAMGSLVGSSSRVETWPAFMQACTAMAGLFLVQYAFAKLRQTWPRFSSVFQNEPLLLMRDGKMIEPALAVSRVAREDLLAKLRESNVHDLTQVRAVVLETTGDVSILHGEAVASTLIEDVRRVP